MDCIVAVDYPRMVSFQIGYHHGDLTCNCLPTALWELHGNNNMEKCKKCGHEYLRDFKCSRSKMKHLTGRDCDDPKCRGKLRDNIINFGESLPDGKMFHFRCSYSMIDFWGTIIRCTPGQF